MTSGKKAIKVAIGSEFLDSFSKIPKKHQGKVNAFISKFRSNPMSAGINFEKIVGAKDPNMRSVRIDKTYRGIVLKPRSGNVYVLLWVDNHDEAYRWAEKRIYAIHPDTGSLQVIQVEASEETPEKNEVENALFSHIGDRNLLRLGLPRLQIPLARSLKTLRDLDAIVDQLPQEAYEALFFLAEGFSLEEVMADLEKTRKSREIDTDDFESALKNPDSRRRFYLVEDDLELAAVLTAPLEKWRIFPHPSQRYVMEKNWNGAVRVLGGAGTGKTIVAMHRARWLGENIFTKDKDRILFTTFTRNLAEDIKDNLTKICPKDIMRRIEVVNLHRWVENFLKKNGYDYKIDYNDKTKGLWEKAVDLAIDDKFDSSFYREEWERVIQPQGIETLQEYMKASRLGRGVRMNRKDRKSVWTVFEEYRASLNENGLREGADAMRDARLILKKNKDSLLPYKAVIVDEAQDMGMQEFKLLRQLIPEESPNDFFIVGDAHQRIYRHKVVLSQCGINIRGRSKKLLINYRTTDETRKWAESLLKGIKIDDLDGGDDDRKGYKSLLHGVYPKIKNFKTFDEEITYIADYLKKIDSETGSLGDICLAARTNKIMDRYKRVLSQMGIQVYPVRRSEPDDRSVPGVRLATMHRVKGLEFDRMIIAGVNDGVVPLAGKENDSSDPTVKEESEINERGLLYVSATRAKKEVLVTSYGKMSIFLDRSV